MPQLILPATLHAQLLAEAKAAFPAECCGLLEGVRDGESVGVSALHPSANLSPTPKTAFEIDPALHFRLLRGLRGTGREIVGCYHSHPTGKALPSSRDRANGCEDGFVWVIIATGVNDTLAAFHGPRFEPLAIKSP
ncbi:MAG: M67 family metallopeptidase [Rhizomicrobium sp.]|nr:M67 family metallopeptidase [Rhizomicrobium sp.]